jgi:hypothetical protein
VGAHVNGDALFIGELDSGLWPTSLQPARNAVLQSKLAIVGVVNARFLVIRASIATPLESLERIWPFKFKN